MYRPAEISVAVKPSIANARLDALSKVNLQKYPKVIGLQHLAKRNWVNEITLIDGFEIL
ncbi:MAG: hypothetical protein ABIY51_10470 [Ferruginibacter sp.]